MCYARVPPQQQALAELTQSNKHEEMKPKRSTPSLRLILESGLCSIAIGSYATILLHSMDDGWDLGNFLWRVLGGAIFSIGFSPPFLGFIPLDENGTNHLYAWPAIAVSMGVLLAAAISQKPFPETAARIQRFGPLCSVIVRVLRYTCYVWLIFIPVGTVWGILCIKYLHHPDSPTEKVPSDKLDTRPKALDTKPDVGD